MNVSAAGPLGTVIESDGIVLKPRIGHQFRDGVNGLIMINRLAFPAPAKDAEDPSFSLDDDAGRAVLRWAADFNLGQVTKLVRQAAARRTRALQVAAARGLNVVRLRAKPEWRLAVGLGNRANAHEIGFSLHGTYGWPVIPGSSLKGLAAAWATSDEADTDPETLRRIFGIPRPGGGKDAAQGLVNFLDAMPARDPVPVVLDVLTPHVKPYYDASAKDSGAHLVSPAEYHNPVPVKFLTVTGVFAVDLIGPDRDDLNQAADWLSEAGLELGAGAKTAAGYGYLDLTPI